MKIWIIIPSITLFLFTIHWVTVQLYLFYCIDSTIFGLFSSIIKSSNPICIALNYTQFNTIKIYYTIWYFNFIFLIKLINKMVIYYRNKILNNDSN
jgi:hypothetical protein